MRPAVEPEHGSLIFSRGLVAQVIGIPSPPGMVAAIPKYELCRDSPLKGSVGFCRLIWSYGPRGVESVIPFARARQDGLYGALMPYFPREEAWQIVRPREALLHALSSPPKGLGREMLEALAFLRSWGLSPAELGLTGSLALRAENPAISDVDFVVYGSRAAERAYYALLSLGEGERAELGGISAIPPLSSGWRRNKLGGTYVSWAGVPLEGELCDPLRSYFSLPTPRRATRAEVKVEGGQASSLLYPPCVEASDGRYLVSFEYLLGRAFYEGGRLEVRALESWDKRVLYLGLRELPGEIRKVSP
ncbi:MAG: hypothetical protein N3F67_00170 [Acidilobaceae archaeon]|nr:hypothetical protein [Acidilobaceae archaeon]